MLGDQLSLFETPRKEKRLLVQERRGQAVYVEADAVRETCECDRFNELGQCLHLAYATDLLSGGDTARYLIKSSFHKELRRGDMAAALHWGRWLDRLCGKSTALGYMQKIWSEETANFDLAVRLHVSATAITIEEAVGLFCSSSKLWERYELWPIWRMIGSVKNLRMPSELECEAAHVAELIGSSDVDELSRLLSVTDQLALSSDPKVKDLAFRLLSALRTNILADLVAREMLDQDVAAVFTKRYRSRRFECEDYMLLAVVAGLLGPRGDVRYDEVGAPNDQEFDATHVNLAPYYSYDYHTVAGKTFMKAWQRKNPGVLIRMGVDTSPVDLRWAGGLLSVFWRFSAFAQAGSTDAMDGLRWHEVSPNDSDWLDMQRWSWWPEDCLR